MKSLSIKFIAFSFVFFTFALGAQAKGFPYASVEGKMSIVFPGEYTSVTENFDYGKTIKVNAEFSNLTYFASFTLHTIPLTDHYELAVAGMESFVESLEGKIESKTDYYVKKNHGVRASITVESLNLKVDYISILVGDIQYQLVVASEKSSWVQKMADTFFKSFKIKK